jgi:hypothetical protein
MAKPEARFYSFSVLPALRKCDLQRIEATTGRGIPDLNVCYQGKEFWVELKVAQRLSGVYRVYMRKEQVAWGIRRAQHGGSVFVCAKFPDHVSVWPYFPLFQTEMHGKYRLITTMPSAQIATKQVKTDLLGVFLGLHN